MKILALDTATERCSVALLVDDQLHERDVVLPRGHAELILPMVDGVLHSAGLRLSDLDAIAFGRGPGAFTGVRIAVGVVQGLAFGAGKSVVGVSNLAAVAAAAPSASGEVLVCMDARMGEVYWCCYQREADGRITPTRDERVGPPEKVDAAPASIGAAVGTGFGAYPDLAARYRHANPIVDALPHARDIARLAVHELAAGRAVSALEAMPVYLRDQVVALP